MSLSLVINIPLCTLYVYRLTMYFMQYDRRDGLIDVSKIILYTNLCNIFITVTVTVSVTFAIVTKKKKNQIYATPEE